MNGRDQHRRNVGNEKLAATILYILRGCSPSLPGVTGLLKLLWYADYWHYQAHLAPITEAHYVAIPDGPVVDNYRDLFDHLQADGYVRGEEVPIQGKDYPKQEYHPLMEPDEELFSETEIEMLDRVVEKLGNLPGSKLSKMTHQEPPWLLVWEDDEPGRDMPYLTFRWLDNLPDEDDLETAAEIIAARPEVQEEITALNQA